MYLLAASTQKKESVKWKQNTRANSSKKKPKKVIVINSDDEHDDNKENKSVVDEFEYQERSLALKERELALREREAKIHALELSNIERERQLSLTN